MSDLETAAARVFKRMWRMEPLLLSPADIGVLTKWLLKTSMVDDASGPSPFFRSGVRSGFARSLNKREPEYFKMPFRGYLWIRSYGGQTAASFLASRATRAILHHEPLLSYTSTASVGSVVLQTMLLDPRANLEKHKQSSALENAVQLGGTTFWPWPDGSPLTDDDLEAFSLRWGRSGLPPSTPGGL